MEEDNDYYYSKMKSFVDASNSKSTTAVMPETSLRDKESSSSSTLLLSPSLRVKNKTSSNNVNATTTVDDVASSSRPRLLQVLVAKDQQHSIEGKEDEDTSTLSTTIRPLPFGFIAEYVRQLHHHNEKGEDDINTMTTIVDVGEEVEWEGRANYDSDNMISLRDLIYQESEHEADCLLNNSSSKNDNDNIDDDDDDDDSTASTRTLFSSSVAIIDNDEELWDPSDPNEAAIIADVELIQSYLLNQNQHHQQKQKQQQQHHHHQEQGRPYHYESSSNITVPSTTTTTTSLYGSQTILQAIVAPLQHQYQNQQQHYHQEQEVQSVNRKRKKEKYLYNNESDDDEDGDNNDHNHCYTTTTTTTDTTTAKRHKQSNVAVE